MAAKLSSLLLFVGWASILSCHPKEPVIAVLPSQLLGTWTSQAGAISEKPFIRWTFKPDYVHTLEDTLKSCQPLDNQHYTTIGLKETFWLCVIREFPLAYPLALIFVAVLALLQQPKSCEMSPVKSWRNAPEIECHLVINPIS